MQNKRMEKIAEIVVTSVLVLLAIGFYIFIVGFIWRTLPEYAQVYAIMVTGFALCLLVDALNGKIKKRLRKK